MSNSSADQPFTVSAHSPVGEVRDLLQSYGAYSRGHREALSLFVEGATLADVVRTTTMPRRLIEELMRALGEDVVSDGDMFAIRPDVANSYRDAFTLDSLSTGQLQLPAAELLDMSSGLVGAAAHIISRAPKPKKALDHVPATPETVVRRALWMNSTYDLAGATLLCVGDHDLTSIVTCLANPELRTVVIDIDEDLLGYIDQVSTERRLNIVTAYSDLRVGIPEIARSCADLIFTDPPYTPNGVRLFLARGLEGLRDREYGRLLMAYGFGSHHPGLGLNVQQTVSDLSLVYEAILPRFNRYIGAQAVGSASDLYVCRPTAQTWKTLNRKTTNAVNIYTHGTQSMEASSDAGSKAVVEAVLAAARGKENINVAATTFLIRGDDGATVPLGSVFDGSAQALIKNARTSAYAADLSDDPGTWVYRALLGVNAKRVALAIPNKHPDITNKAAQDALQADFSGKWAITYVRSTPDPRHAILVAEEVDPSRQGAIDVARRLVLGGASRKLENAWRDALIKAVRVTGGVLTKNQARDIIASCSGSPGVLERSVASLPRQTIRFLMDAVEQSVKTAERQLTA